MLELSVVLTGRLVYAWNLLNALFCPLEFFTDVYKPWKFLSQLSLLGYQTRTGTASGSVHTKYDSHGDPKPRGLQSDHHNCNPFIFGDGVFIEHVNVRVSAEIREIQPPEIL